MDYILNLKSVSNLEMVQTNYQVKYTLASAQQANKAQRYVHPKGAPDADLIFGSNTSNQAHYRFDIHKKKLLKL
jgi:hypothetical protein